LKKISVIIASRHATSISLEDEFYNALCAIAQERNLSIPKLITEIDNNKTITNLSSAIRVYILKHYQQKLEQI
jgi:predicted DNA-binding ribbon-helix-helix protein